MKKLLVIIVVFSLYWQMRNHTGTVMLGPGIKAPEVPEQVKLEVPNIVQHEGFTISQVARFSLQAKVLAKENYYIDSGSDISPVDLALGWGPMSDETVLKTIEITQSNRFYWWQTDKLPLPRRDIETNSANMHLIPANNFVADNIEDIRVGDVIELSGYLVDASSTSKNWHWKTSLNRKDTGNGACELVWVEDFQILTSDID